MGRVEAATSEQAHAEAARRHGSLVCSAALLLLAGCSGGEETSAPVASEPPSDRPTATWALEEAPRVLAAMTDRAAAERLGDRVQGVLLGVPYCEAGSGPGSSHGFVLRVLVLPDGRVRTVSMSEGCGTRRLSAYPTPTPAGLEAWDTYLRWAIVERRCEPLTIITDEEVNTVAPERMEVVEWGAITAPALAERCSPAMGWLRQGARPSSPIWFIVFTSTGKVSGHCAVTPSGLACGEDERTVRFYGDP